MITAAKGPQTGWVEQVTSLGSGDGGPVKMHSLVSPITQSEHSYEHACIVQVPVTTTSIEMRFNHNTTIDEIQFWGASCKYVPGEVLSLAGTDGIQGHRDTRDGTPLFSEPSAMTATGKSPELLSCL